MRYAATIWVGGESLAEIDLLRRLFDAQHEAVGAHITVVYPQPIACSEEELLEVAARAGKSARPFSVRIHRWTDIAGLQGLHGPGTEYLTAAFPAFPKALVLLPAEGAANVLALRRELDTAFHQPPVVLDHPPFLTIGQGMADAEFAAASTALARYRPRIELAVRAFDILREDETGAMRSLRSVALDG